MSSSFLDYWAQCTSWRIWKALALGGKEVIANNIWALKSGTIWDRTRKLFSLYWFLPPTLPPENEWFLITFYFHLQSQILKEPGRIKAAGEFAALSNDYLMHLCHLLSLLCENTWRKYVSPLNCSQLFYSPFSMLVPSLALISLCICQR